MKRKDMRMRVQNNRLRKKVNEIITKETTFFWLKNNIYYILTHTKKQKQRC